MNKAENIPEEVGEAMQYEVARHGLEYADNFRAYRRKDGLFKADYEAKTKRGCCGFFQSSTVDKQGDEWVIGCNHGH